MLSLRIGPQLAGARGVPPSRTPRIARAIRTRMWFHVLVSAWYAVKFGAATTGIVWPGLYLGYELDGHRDAGGASAAAAIAVGLAVTIVMLWAQLRHVGRAARTSRTWMVLHDDKPVGLLDEAAFEEMQLIALRRADNAWGQVAVILGAVWWLLRTWLSRVPAAAFWTVVLTGLVDREAFFKLALAFHPDAFESDVIGLFCFGTALMAAAIAVWAQALRRKGPPWKHCYRADVQRQLHEHLGVPRAGGRWVLVPQRQDEADEEAFSDTVPDSGWS